jgi:hypothetical protein
VPGQVSVLTRHFFWRFFDNDLVSPDTDIHETAAFLLAFLVAPCVLEVPGLAFKYGNTFTPPLERIAMIVGDQFGYVSWSMLVVALVTTMVWDGLSLDARDHAILGHLPIAPRAMFAGKLRAVAGFVLALVVAVNGISAVAFPLLAPGPRATIGAAAALMAGHVAATTGAALFGFFAVLSVRGLFMNLLGPSLFTRLSLALQFLLCLACALAYLSLSTAPLERGGAALHLAPPMWFLGLYQFLSPRVIEGIPVAHEAVFAQLGRVAVVATGAAAATGLGLYLAGHFRFASHKPLTFAVRSSRGRAASRVVAAVARGAVRDPLGRATFLFTVETIARSARHRLYVAGYLLAGCVVCYLTVVPLTSDGGTVRFRPANPQVLAIQAILALALLVGVRVALAVPGELKAAWLFRLTAGGAVDARRYVTGVRRAVVACFLVPLMGVLLPLQSALWGIRYGTAHFACGLLWALAVNEFLLMRLAKLPFTCARAAGKNRLMFRWPVYLAGFSFCTYWFARLEYAAFSAGRAEALLIALGCLYAGVVAYRHLTAAHGAPFVFDEAPEGATTLDL